MSQLDDSTWTFTVNEHLSTPGKFLFGGCGLAAGLVALEDASGRPAVWASAHYLSHAPLGSPVTVATSLVAVGGHITQARATAYVEEREILTVNASLGTGELSSPTPWTIMPHVAPPDDCPPREFPDSYARSIFEHVETRVALGRNLSELDGPPSSPVSAVWSRVPGHFEPSAATLAIFGDFVATGVSHALGRRAMGRSLDNTLRIVEIEPTEWVLCEIHIQALHRGFAQGTGYLWSPRGTLLAIASQTISVRLYEPPTC